MTQWMQYTEVLKLKNIFFKPNNVQTSTVRQGLDDLYLLFYLICLGKTIKKKI